MHRGRSIRRGDIGVAVKEIDLDLPDGTSVLRDVAFASARSEALLIEGPTGAGKSTLLRAIAGIRPRRAIIYEDSAAGKRARHFYNRVIRELVDECDFSLELWNFEVLAVPEIGNPAAKAAAQADFVILSCTAKLSFPSRQEIGSKDGPG
jgi:energy-coupling factor transporter ATP-binding protein EcfA2